MARNLSDVIRIMRLAISRRNENDPDSNDDTLVQYINDFYSLSMSDEVKLFEQFGTLEFTIDESNTTGVYTFNDVGADFKFVNIMAEGFISLTDPPNGSVSWNPITFLQDPGTFYAYWGINNTDILIPGFPTEMLYYGKELVFRTIPNTSYDVKIYGYKQNFDFSTSGDPELPFDYWLRYIAYGAALNYAEDYNLDAAKKASIERCFNRESKRLLTRTHNQRKVSRSYPRF